MCVAPAGSGIALIIQLALSASHDDHHHGKGTDRVILMWTGMLIVVICFVGVIMVVIMLMTSHLNLVFQCYLSLSFSGNLCPHVNHCYPFTFFLVHCTHHPTNAKQTMASRDVGTGQATK